MKQITALTGLRAVAAYGVLFAHNTSYLFAPDQQHLAYLVHLSERLAYFSMSLFFVLSGFVIHLNYADLITSRGGVGVYKFFVARFSRLYPLYGLWLFSYYSQGSPNPRNDVFWSHLTLTQSWVNLQDSIFSATWSVSTEWFFYIVFVPAILLLPAGRRPNLSLVIYLVAAPLGLFTIFHFRSAIIGVLATFLPQGTGSADLWLWFIYYCPAIRLAEFVAGALCARIFLSGAMSTRLSSIFGAAGLGWCVIVLFGGEVSWGTPLQDIIPNFIYTPGLCAILLCCCQTNVVSRALSTWPLRAAGEISYSVYLLQWGVQAHISLAFPPGGWRVAAVVGMTTVVSAFAFVLIEWPARKILQFLLELPIEGLYRAPSAIRNLLAR